MPDRAEGYVRRGQGILPRDMQMAELYFRNASHELVRMDCRKQLAAIEAIRDAVAHIECRLYFVATDQSHIHVLVSWHGARSWRQNRNSIKKSLTITFKQKYDRRPWFSEGASRKQVREQAHFDHLVTRYLPRHKGWKWCERRGLFQ